ncbi:TauD/TfdA family dioxygenase [Candidatus Poribacteria bacterium]|nr:TauD/TfdA family dioxygenase [Candidatus Poribacteria bacterium]
MNSSQMLTDCVSDDRAWRSNTIDDTTAWYYPLSQTCLASFERIIHDARCQSKPITEIYHPSALPNGGDECLQPALDALNLGRGFTIIERVPTEQYVVEEALSMYWLIGQFLGTPVEQNIEGTLLYDVRDTGQHVTQGARFSVTNAESSFHNDNSFGELLPDLVGLLCLHTAKSGGQSQLISGYALHNELLQNYPDTLETLYQLFCFDRRGQFQVGESPTSEFPIFQWSEDGLTLRYLHYYIQVGHERAGKSLTTDQRRALEVVEGLLCRADFRVEFNLQPGQMLFTNNRWILHNRTAFEDYSDPERRRHYVRLWLRQNG